MSKKSLFGGPEVVGLGFVGATIGSVVCGGAGSDWTPLAAGGALVGAAVVPALVLTPWQRLLRLRPQAAIRTHTEANSG